MFEENLEANLASLMKDLKTRGTFVPKPLRRVWIAKDPQGTKFRPLGIPAVRDRVAQEVIRRLLAPIFATVSRLLFRVSSQTQLSLSDSASVGLSRSGVLYHIGCRHIRLL